jgi:hypothetical protein
MQSKDKTSRVFAIIGLVVGVVALAVGFAAFTQNLTIKSSADVTPASSVLDIVFSTSKTAKQSGSVTATPSTGATGDAATIEATGTVIKDLKAHFTAPGQTVTYNFNVYNASAYVAYLKSITFNNVSGGSATKVCTAKTGTTQSYVDAACNGISLTVSVGDSTPYTRTLAQGTETAASGSSLRSLAATTGEAVSVTIEYAAGSSEADGDFDVAFGDIVLGYSSVQ